MAESAVSSVANYLGGLLVNEAKFLGKLPDQIDDIYDEMVQMQCFLKDADARQHESEGVRNLVVDIRDLAYDAEDIIESYIHNAKYTSSFNPKKYKRLHRIGNEIEKLQSKIQAVARRVPTYNFIRFDQGEGPNSTTERQRQLRQSHPHNDDEAVVGIKDNIELLVAELINAEGPHLVSIVGMGGLGKTTLATKVFNHDDIKHHFDCCAWAFISQEFQVRTILQRIIRKVCIPNEETSLEKTSNEEKSLEKLSDEELLEKLSMNLKDKCYLVVLDDIWSTEAWDVLKHGFPNGKMGSKIMLTTRNKEVALYVDPSGFLHEPVCLTKEQSWELFCKRAFHWKNVDSTSSSLYPPKAEAEKKEKLGRDMIKKCGGLPLAIAVLGGLLAMKQSIHEWEIVAKDIGRYMNKVQQKKEQHGVSWILSLSYYDLHSYLKPCFLYMARYPEDTEFHKRELIHMWMAEGFLQHDGQGITKEEMGEEYLHELINRSMVQVSERSFRGKVKKCRLHDLVRDLCLEKAKEENFLCTFDTGSSIGDSSSSTLVEESTYKHRRMCRHAIHFSCDRYVISMQQLPTSRRSPHLRALFLWEPISEVESIASINFISKEFNFLKVLVLEGMTLKGHLPKAIGKLIHLRYLRLTGESYNSIVVPQSIGNLQSLQFLTLDHIKRLPNVLWKMEQLRYCCVRHSCLDSKMVQVDGLKNLTSLELSVWGIEKLQLGINLRKLGLYGINGADCKSLHRFSISRADRLQCLSLGFWNDTVRFDDFDWSPLSCCRSLWKLHLGGGFRLKRLPKKWEEFLPNLTKLSLEAACLEEDPIPILEMLPNLETLTLECHPAYHEVAAKKYYFSSKGFGKLQYLRLIEIFIVEELEVEKGALPCLVHLQIKDCRRLRMLPEGLKFITSLKKLEVIYVHVRMQDKFIKRLREDGDDWHKIQHIPSIMIRQC